MVVGILALLGIRLNALSMLKGNSNLKPTNPQSKTKIHFGVFFANKRKIMMAKTRKLATMLIFTALMNKPSILFSPHSLDHRFDLFDFFVFKVPARRECGDKCRERTAKALADHLFALQRVKFFL